MDPTYRKINSSLPLASAQRIRRVLRARHHALGQIRFKSPHHPTQIAHAMYFLISIGINIVKWGAILAALAATGCAIAAVAVLAALAAAGCAMVGGAVVVPVLGLLGFSSGGVVAGRQSNIDSLGSGTPYHCGRKSLESTAAAIQSCFYGGRIASGSLFAIAQSLSATA
ncbi:hypothetical protein BU17DRAFT_94486 [Hysterangium stoloniferum]|nr:hypothetical protein BU17DRAFT_94486 [Hysterangium stoloniferum]